MHTLDIYENSKYTKIFFQLAKDWSVSKINYFKPHGRGTKFHRKKQKNHSLLNKIDPHPQKKVSTGYEKKPTLTSACLKRVLWNSPV